MSRESLLDTVRGLAQGAEMIGGFIVAMGYMFAYSNEVAPGWKPESVVNTEEVRGRLRLGLMVRKDVALLRSKISRLGSNPIQALTASVPKSPHK